MKAHKTVAALVLGLVCVGAPSVSRAATAIQISGVIAGVVSDPYGIPQMGATVQLYNRQERLFGKVLTDDRGEFKFLGLFPDLYSVRISLASFVPALRKDILVQPGMRSILNVNLNNLFSSIQVLYPPIENGGMMTDDWKWVLRSAASTRPVLRFVDEAHTTTTRTAHTSVFSGTRGIVRLSAGEATPSTGVANEADMGTAFALATSMGGNLLQVSGNVGYGSQTGVPAAAFRTTYSRNVEGGGPEVSLTMRQLLLTGRLGTAVTGSEALVPILRNTSAGFEDSTRLSENVTLRYGGTLESVTFLDRLNYFSPYARMTYVLGEGEEVSFAFTSGNARPYLAGLDAEDAELQRDLNTLGLFPRISVRDGHPRVQRGGEYEATYSRKVGSRTYSASAYRESVTDAALSLVAPEGFYGKADILPDVFSGSSTFNAGSYQSAGYTAAVTQHLGEDVDATLVFGSTGALTADARELTSNSPDELRSMLRMGRKNAAALRVSATSHRTGTHMIASYQWTADRRWAMPGNLYSTQATQCMPGFNVFIRQPIPGLSRRVEATADLRNLLAQGYLPLGIVDGQRVMLVQTPRSLRGGLAFIF